MTIELASLLQCHCPSIGSYHNLSELLLFSYKRACYSEVEQKVALRSGKDSIKKFSDTELLLVGFIIYYDLCKLAASFLAGHRRTVNYSTFLSQPFIQ